MDAVGPEVDIVPGRQIPLQPVRVLVRPNLGEPRHGRGRQAAGVRPEQGRQRLGEVARGDALEVEDGDQDFEALRAPRIRRQERGAEPDAVGALARAVANAWRANRNRADAGHDLAFAAQVRPWRTTRRRPELRMRASEPWPMQGTRQPPPRPPANQQGPGAAAQSPRSTRSGRWPWRTSRRRPSSVRASEWPSRNAATSASTARASRDRAPLRSTSVNGSENVDGWESFKTVLSLTAYHSFVGEVEARSPPRYAALTLHPVTNFWP